VPREADANCSPERPSRPHPAAKINYDAECRQCSHNCCGPFKRNASVVQLARGHEGEHSCQNQQDILPKGSMAFPVFSFLVTMHGHSVLIHGVVPLTSYCWTKCFLPDFQILLFRMYSTPHQVMNKVNQIFVASGEIYSPSALYQRKSSPIRLKEKPPNFMNVFSVFTGDAEYIPMKAARPSRGSTFAGSTIEVAEVPVQLRKVEKVIPLGMQRSRLPV
jgi:hypothetical protein